MRLIFYVQLLLFSMVCHAQSGKTALKDDLLSDKQIVLAQYIPMFKGTFQYELYAMPVKSFIKRMDAYKSALGSQYRKEKDPSIKKLKAKDADFSVRLVASRYMESYGLDSMGSVRVHDMIESNKYDDLQIDSAYKRAFVKQLSATERSELDKIIEASADVNEEALFKRSAAYRRWLDGHISLLRTTKYKADTTLGYNGDDLVRIKVVNQEISNPFIKAYFNYKITLTIIKMVKGKTIVADAYKNFMATATEADYKAEIEEVYANYKRMEENAVAPDFNYMNIDGQSVTLKDLRGKYVYIDIWATWCAPCRAEVPFLRQLEQAYERKNIYFVSISVDKMANKDKWMSYVKEHHLSGIQLIADKDFNSEFVTQFNVNSIPRFILIDPSGRIISGDANKPSNPELRKQLDVLLR